MIAGCLILSYCSKVKALDVSISMYNVFCEWSALTFMLTSIPLFFVIIIGMLHIRRSYKDALLLPRFVEFTTTVVIFVTPVCAKPDFHAHHWYCSWLLGMNTNLRYWWSFAFQAFLWGVYINGIAVWGRDEVLGCYQVGYALSNQMCYEYCYEPWAEKGEFYKNTGMEVGGSGGFEDDDSRTWKNCEGST